MTPEASVTPLAVEAARPAEDTSAHAPSSTVRVARGLHGELPPCTPGDEIAPGFTVVRHLHRSHGCDTYEVWSAERMVACIAKTLRPDCADDERIRAALIAEGSLLGRLRHPHIVRVYDLIARPQPTIILEVIPGPMLTDLIATRRRRLIARDLAILGQQIAAATIYLHRQGMLHLDLKPENVLIAKGAAHVIDFSLARAPGPGLPGEGTPAYLAPEQATGAVLTPATDSWGIGATLYHAATGEPPFPESATGHYAQLGRRASPVRARRRLPVGLASLIDACLDPAPDGRPSPLAIHEALAPLASAQ